MPARSPNDATAPPTASQTAPGHAGAFGPDAYVDWRASSLGALTEQLERRLILGLADDLEGRDVLDIGCGDGALTRALRDRGAARVVGCDLDPRMLARPRRGA